MRAIYLLTKPRKLLKFEDGLGDPSCVCDICKGKIAFHAPTDLVDEFINGQVVLFVGAGVSTEAPTLLHYTLYERISYLIGNKDINRPFPDVMEEFCAGATGKGALIQEIQKRLDYIYSHRDLYQDAVEFHGQLATFFPIDTIVTTNWDTYFEDECGATAFVDDKDIPLWNAAKRRVLKIHGTIANFGSIIATKTDYAKCARKLRTGILGAHLKSLLATRTVVFIGYSLRDDDFLQIFEATRKHLAEFHRQAFFVSPTISDSERDRLHNMKLNLIETDGKFFISKLKQHAQSKGFISSDDMYDDTESLLVEVIDAHIWLHDRFNSRKYPQIMISSWYQDGLMDALSRILRLRRTGEYSDRRRLVGGAQHYYELTKRYQRDKKFSDAAYCEGYATGMLYACQPSKPRISPPLFFHFGGFGTSGRSTYQRSVSKLPLLHQGAYRYVTSCLKKFPPHEDLVLHHKAQLNFGRYVDDDGFFIEPKRNLPPKRK